MHLLQECGNTNIAQPVMLDFTYSMQLRIHADMAHTVQLAKSAGKTCGLLALSGTPSGCCCVNLNAMCDPLLASLPVGLLSETADTQASRGADSCLQHVFDAKQVYRCETTDPTPQDARALVKPVEVLSSAEFFDEKCLRHTLHRDVFLCKSLLSATPVSYSFLSMMRIIPYKCLQAL